MTTGHAGQLAFERRGEGPPVVLLHGIGHDRHGWDPVTDRLTPHHELVLADLPGHGGSPLSPGGGPLGVIELTDRVERLLDELHLDSPLIAGNSLGGAIALELARRGRARGVVALAPIGFWSRLEVAYVVAALRGSRGLARLLAPLLPALVRRSVVRATTMGLYFAHPLRLSADETLRTMRAFADAPGVRAILPYSRRYLFGNGRGIDQEAITIAWGTRDLLLIGGQARRARTLLPAARHVRLAGSGHVPMSDDPAGVAGLILAQGRRKPSGSSS
ncbi:alpha/beta fold hydrolase [Nonomuraea sp. NPDC003707]